jgi:hypothetical protein
MPARKVSLLDDPGYAEAVARYGELQAEVSNLQKSISDLQSRLTIAAGSDSADEEALSLVSGGGNGLENASHLRTQLDDSRHRLAVVERALALQRQIVTAERARASKVVADAKRPEYKTIIGTMAKAMRALKAAIESELAFREELIAGDVSFSAAIPPMALPSRFDGSNSADADRWLAEAAAVYGL